MGTVDNNFVLHGLMTHRLNHGKNCSAPLSFDFVVRDNLWFSKIRIKRKHTK